MCKGNIISNVSFNFVPGQHSANKSEVSMLAYTVGSESCPAGLDEFCNGALDSGTQYM